VGGTGRNCGGRESTTRRVLLHAGTHKTGTTSLQALFTRHRSDLADHGILYPRRGVPPNGYNVDSHTNVAWQLMGHNSFDPAWGTLDDLIDEISSSDCQKVLLSSENFSLLFNKPARLRQLKESFEGIGCTPHISLVFRDVSEFADSLYITLLGYGLTLDYAEYSRRVAEEGLVTKDGTTYCFNNAVLERSFADVFGEGAVTDIDYDAKNVVRSFLDTFDWFLEGALDAADLSIRNNTTMDRVEGLRDLIRNGEARIADLEAEVERLTAEDDRLAARLAVSEQRFSHRFERKLRSSLARPGRD